MICAVVCILCAGTGCGVRRDKTPDPESGQASALTFADDLGRTVVVKGTPTSVVALAPSVTEMLVALGESAKLKGVTQWCDNPAASGVEKIGNLTSPDIERIIEIAPSLVVGTEMTPRHVYDSLETAGITCVVFKHRDLADVMTDMRRLSEVLGDAEQGERVLAEMTRRREALVASIAEKPFVKVALLYDLDSMGSAGKGSWVDDMFSSVKLDNVANRAQSSWPRLSREALLLEQPRWILLPLPADPAEAAALKSRIEALKSDPVWGRVEALAEGRMLLVPANLLNIPGPRTLEAMEYLNGAIRKPE